MVVIDGLIVLTSYQMYELEIGVYLYRMFELLY